MKVIILAGGKGTRLAEYTKKIPKPMVKVNGRPIITYIIDHYLKFGISLCIAAYEANGDVAARITTPYVTKNNSFLENDGT